MNKLSIKLLAMTCMLGIVAFGLSGCMTSITKTNESLANVTESEQFDKMCRLIPLAKSMFDLIKSQIQISDNIVQNVELAYTSGIRICNNPPKDIGAALVTVTGLYGDILNSNKSVSTYVAGALAAQATE